ncbi:MAG: hypothetical protein AAFV95_19560 [Bacteroidota bacterium]
MKSFQKFYLLFSLIAFLATPSWSQVVIRPVSTNSPIFNFDQLLQFQLVNTGTSPVKGIVQIQVEDNYSNGILQINSLPISVAVGASMDQQQVQWEGGIKLGENQFARWLAQSGGLPRGQYIYCYRFLEAQSGRTLGNFCQENSSTYFRLPELVYPFHEATLQNRFPVLSWRPPVPLQGNNLRYNLKLVELLRGQSPLEAIHTNIPLLEKYHLSTLSLPYPPTGIPLEKDQQYAWQVTAFWNEIEIGKTNIWTFSIEEEEIEKEEPQIESYRLVKQRQKGSPYVFTDALYFAYDNRAFESELTYSIHAKNASREAMTNLPSIALTPGMNEIKLDIDKHADMEAGQHYVLTIWDRYQVPYYLEFKYLADEEH